MESLSMCGIVGYYEYECRQRIEPDVFRRSIDLLSHRGPDASGIYTDLGIGLGHRRLSIIDISDAAAQPMASSDKQIWLTYNGELYNFPELKILLQQKGYHFRSSSDTEVVLHAYIEWGIECVRRFNGIFAFAIWDARLKRMFLVRDHIGVKPLFYTDYNGIFYFASEVPALLNFPNIPREPDYLGIDSYFTFSYIPAPYTGYKHIRQLLPGHYLIFEKKSQHIIKYWDVPFGEKKIRTSEQEYLDEMDALFAEVVARQMISDVPVGIFLSAGTDSFAIARTIVKTGKKDIQAFSIGFKHQAFNELDKTRLAAKTLEIPLISQNLGEDIEHIIDHVARHSQEPFADSSSLPLYLLSEMASRHVKVVLSGDGADELLGGYPIYKANHYAEIYRRFPSWIRTGLLRPLARWVPDIGGKYTYKEKVSRFLYGAEQGKGLDHVSWRVFIHQEWKKKLYTPDFYHAVKEFNPLELYLNHILHAKAQGCSDLDACLYADLKFYLPNDMLVKVDRMSMAHGLEVRVPFLDIEMVTFCWQLPEYLKIHHGTLKYILRKLIADCYPRTLQQMPKSGFNVITYRNLWSQKTADSKNPFYRPQQLAQLHRFSRYRHFLNNYLFYMFNYVVTNNYERACT